MFAFYRVVDLLKFILYQMIYYMNSSPQNYIHMISKMGKYLSILARYKGNFANIKLSVQILWFKYIHIRHE